MNLDGTWTRKEKRKKKKKKKEKVWDTAIRYKIVPTIRKFENKMLLGKEGRKEASERARNTR